MYAQMHAQLGLYAEPQNVCAIVEERRFQRRVKMQKRYGL
jgi:hypothetical protein